MIKAIKQDGTISYFREAVWDLMGVNKNGYVELKDGEEPVNVPSVIKEFQAKKKVVDVTEQMEVTSQPEVTSEKMVGDEAATMDIMKEFLDKKGIKYHPNIGYDKLKAKYDANKK